MLGLGPAGHHQQVSAAAEGAVSSLKSKGTSMTSMDYSFGCRVPVDEWITLNRTKVFSDPSLRRFVAPFPPSELMQNVSGLTSEVDFASHGADLYLALSKASAKPLSEYEHILDFGCGCGRLARMFKGHPHRLSGCDIDRRHIIWMQSALPYLETCVSSVRPPLPYADNTFDAIISISIFTHLTEKSQDEFLADLQRVSRRCGFLFLTVHGDRALKRAIHEPAIRNMIDVPDASFEKAQELFVEDRHAFILQYGHLTTAGSDGHPAHGSDAQIVFEPFEYGIAFVSESYVRSHWGRWFEITDYRQGAIHAFQDIVVLRPRK